MTNTLTMGASVVTPDLVKPYSYARPSKNIIHTMPGSEDDSYTLSPAGKRQGSMDLCFTDVADAQAAEVALATSGVWAYEDTYNTFMNMNLIVNGDIAPAQQDNLSWWILTLPFKEV